MISKITKTAQYANRYYAVIWPNFRCLGAIQR